MVTFIRKWCVTETVIILALSISAFAVSSTTGKSSADVSASTASNIILENSEAVQLNRGASGTTNLKSTSSVIEQVLSDWYKSKANKHMPACVVVGKEGVYIKDIQAFPYVFKCGAVLHSTAGGYCLVLNNVYVSEQYHERAGIDCDGDLAIMLDGENYISGGIWAGDWINPTGPSGGDLLVFGTGTLLVDEGEYFMFGPHAAIQADNLSIMGGCSVTINNTGSHVDEILYTGYDGIVCGGQVLFSGCVVNIYGTSFAIDGENVYLLGAILSIQSSYGIEASSQVVIDGCIVNMLVNASAISHHDGGYYMDIFYVSHSYLSVASTNTESYSYYSRESVIRATEVYFEHCVGKIYSKSGSCINGSTVIFGEGDYYLGTGTNDDRGAAIMTYNFALVGGNVNICAPGSIGIYTDSDYLLEPTRANSFEVTSGRYEIMEKFDVYKMLKFDAELAMAYATVAAAGQFNVAGITANFYSQIIIDAVSNGILASLEGKSYAAGYIGGGKNTFYGYYWQEGGTVWCDKSQFGFLFDDGTGQFNGASLVFNGGSYKGAFTTVGYNLFMGGWMSHNSVNPNSLVDNVVERNLQCVEYVVPGAKKYDKITQNWWGLPSYYGTQSLYTDDEGKLYFWLSQRYNDTPEPATTQLLELKPGWNLVTLTRAVDEEGVAKFISLRPLRLSNTRKCYVRCINKNDIQAGTGYWIFSPQKQTLEFRHIHTSASTETALTQGWNLVGFSDNSTWMTEVSEIWEWLTNKFQKITKDELTRGKAYWVIP